MEQSRLLVEETVAGALVRSAEESPWADQLGRSAGESSWADQSLPRVPASACWLAQESCLPAGSATDYLTLASWNPSQTGPPGG